MKLWRPAPAYGAQTIRLLVDDDHGDWQTAQAVAEVAARGTADRQWVAPAARVVTDGAHPRAADPFFRRPFPLNHSDVMVDRGRLFYLRRDAAATVAPLLTPYGDLHPVACENAELQFWRCTRVVDCFDEEAADVVRAFDEPERILSLDRPAFRVAAVPAEGIFVLPEPYPAYAWATDDFVRGFRASGARGLRFTLQWDSDAPQV